MKWLVIFLIVLISGCSVNRSIEVSPVEVVTRTGITEYPLIVEFSRGKSFNYPSVALWIEDMEGRYIETLFVTGYVATGRFGHGEIEPGRWKNEPGEVRRPAALPYWSHKRGIKAEDGLYAPSPSTAVTDAVTSATPRTGFKLTTSATNVPGSKFRLLAEVNQPWDSNQYWSNNKYPDDRDYSASLQPSLVYAVTIDPALPDRSYYLNPIGHGHYSGKDGSLNTNLTTLTTAKDIFRSILVTLKPSK